MDTSHPQDCLFCKIIAKTIPADIFFENENILAFLDIHPHSKGHALVIPKQHSSSVLSLNLSEVASLYGEVHYVAQIITAALNAKAVNIISNSGSEAGQIIFHTHVHIIPRYDHSHTKSYTYTDEEKAKTIEALRFQAKSR